MTSLPDLDSEKIQELKKVHDDLVEQNRLVAIRLEQGISSFDSLLNEEKDLETERLIIRKRDESYLKREGAYLKRIKELEEQLEVSKSIENVKQMVQMAQKDMVFLKEELALARSERAVFRPSMENNEAVVQEEEEERAAKRQRE